MLCAMMLGMKTRTNAKERAIAKSLTPLVNVVLLSTAHAQLLREEINAIGKQILESRNYQVDGRRITEHADAWLLEDGTLSDYRSRMACLIRAAGHVVPDGFCPALMAEEFQRKAERALVDASTEFFGVSAQALACSGMQNYRKFIDSLIGFCVCSPGYRKPTTATLKATQSLV